MGTLPAVLAEIAVENARIAVEFPFFTNVN
jgi:hypothetical protein